ncbi:MAG: ATP synthase F1 subunit delta [Acidobacteria bacterium]|nr:ATP synthase F1 subunit delta [Acidobacteriota bacterium]MXX85766.1 ATP synthase F1 subunit delta [Acidobacteriota bacterium]MYE44300.1 ATP synthase F1 subunit delta [Acidobacteriota bacterium]MYG74522.1 ATP synthase F1 subunit delta [Acidobacteriota bacterium]
MPSEVARHYARVLLDTVAATGDGEDLEALAGGLQEFAASLERSPELLTTLTSPAIPRGRRAAVAKAVADRILPDSDLGRFVALMVSRERSDHLAETAAAFRAALDEHRGIVEAEVVSARQLDERDRASLRTALASAFAGTPRLHFREDPELLGGFVIRIGNRIYDASVNRQLSRFEEKYGV